MIKLIATDVDGTLVKDGTMTINPEYMTVIRELPLWCVPGGSMTVRGSCLSR